MRDRYSTAIYCNFCGKGKNEVSRMVASPGPSVTHICGECIDLLAHEQASVAVLAVQTSTCIDTLISLETSAKAAVVRGVHINRPASELMLATRRARHELRHCLQLWLQPDTEAKPEAPIHG